MYSRNFSGISCHNQHWSWVRKYLWQRLLVWISLVWIPGEILVVITDHRAANFLRCSCTACHQGSGNNQENSFQNCAGYISWLHFKNYNFYLLQHISRIPSCTRLMYFFFQNPKFISFCRICTGKCINSYYKVVLRSAKVKKALFSVVLWLAPDALSIHTNQTDKTIFAALLCGRNDDS